MSHLKHTVVAILLFGEDFERLLIITRSNDSIRHLRAIKLNHSNKTNNQKINKNIFFY